MSDLLREAASDRLALRGPGDTLCVALYRANKYNATLNIPALVLRENVAELARASSGGLVSVDDAAKRLGITTRQAAIRMAALARRGWLSRVRRGLYQVRPLEAAAGSEPVAEDPWVLARELYAPCYIGGWSAAEHWHLTEQLFNTTFVATAAPRRRQRERRLGTEFHIARIPAARMHGVKPIWRGTVQVAVSDRERTLVDALRDPSWVGGVRHLADMLEEYAGSAELDAKKFIARLHEANSGAAYKRAGYLIEQLWPHPEIVVAEALRHRTKGFIRLDPAVKSRGRMLRRWGLWINVAIEAHER